MALLDFFFPKFCVQCKKWGDYLCATCFTHMSFDVSMICFICNKYAIDGKTHPNCQGKYVIDGAFASVVYTGVVKKLVYQFKYEPYLTNLQGMLTDFFYEGLIQQEMFQNILQQHPLLVPIPLHPYKYKMRGYNQAQLLSKNLGKKLGLQTIPILKRTKKTLTQADLKRDDRLQNMKDAFAIDARYKDRVDSPNINTPLLLIDDIITSGATMLEAARVLKKAGAKAVWGAALAHGI